MQIHVHRVQPLRHVAFALRGCDVPDIAKAILDACAALAVLVIRRRADRRRAGSSGPLVRGIRVLHVDVKRRRVRFAAPRQLRCASADHHHRVADANFGVDATRRADRPECLLRSEHTHREIDQRRRVVDDQVRRHGMEAFRDEARRLGRGLLFLHRLEAAMHVVDREILFAHLRASWT